MDTKPIGPFLGINNRRPDYNLAIRTRDVRGNYVRAAVDVMINGTGVFKTRKSADLLQAMTGAHSMFEDYFVRDSVLYRFQPAPYCESLVKVLSTDARGGWVRVGDDLYFSNGVDGIRIASSGAVFPWGMPTAESPEVVAIGGDLNAGWYQVATSYINEDTGEESGVSPSCNFELQFLGGIRVATPPAVPGATHFGIYISGCNGEVPAFYCSVPVSEQFVDIIGPALGRQAAQRYEAVLPAGDQLFYYNGRLCSIKDKVVYYGLPFRPGYYLPVEGYIPFPETVSIAVPAQNGVYVASDKTYWFPGDIGQLTDQIQDVLPYGAVKGTGFVVPNKSKFGWFGHKGIVIADIQGEVEAVMSDNIELAPPSEGVSSVIEDSFSRRVVSCGWCVNLDNFSATTFSGYDFTSVSGRYATKPDGIYDLLGVDDVEGFIDFGRIDFGDEHRKHMPAVYLGSISDTPLSLTIECLGDDGALHSYTYPARAAGSLAMRRVDPGAGLRATWFHMTLTGVNFDLASLSFAPTTSKRRI